MAWYLVKHRDNFTFTHAKDFQVVCSFCSGFSDQILYATLIPLMRATCSARLILLDFITLIISGEAYKVIQSPPP
jgi:hypothetical protein